MNADLTLPNNPTHQGMAYMSNELTFTCEGHSQRITLIAPSYSAENGHPLVVFLQGSGWTDPNRFAQLPQLCRYAQQGIAIAAITHRDSTQGHPFPAYLKDAKAAIRFLRENAQELGIDPERIGFFGTSSGGNTALLVGLTGDDPRYRTAEYTHQSDAVACVVDCFGPSDMVDFEGSPLSRALMANPGLSRDDLLAMQGVGQGDLLGILLALAGEKPLLELAQAMSPLREVKDGAAYPPFLLLHGDRDDLVPYSQSARMHQRLLDAGADSRLIKVSGAEHEGSFWSQELHERIFAFLAQRLL